MHPKSSSEETIGMTDGSLEEYRALRATIRERGTARVCIFVLGTVAWATLTVASSAASAPPVATLVPLLVLVASFEAIFALHVGVERIGRYLQVAFDDGWEKAAGGFGRPTGAAVVDALFVAPFLLAALCNLMPALIAGPTSAELTFIGGAHALFVIRVLVAKQTAGRQRAIDAARFHELRGQPPASSDAATVASRREP
jgi:hypothetical protein